MNAQSIKLHPLLLHYKEAMLISPESVILDIVLHSSPYEQCKCSIIYM